MDPCSVHMKHDFACIQYIPSFWRHMFGKDWKYISLMGYAAWLPLLGLLSYHSWSLETHCNWARSWWRNQMGTFSALLAICAGNSPVPGEFPTQRPVTRSFDLRPNKRLSKQSWGWWFETPSCPLWRHRNDVRYHWAILSSCSHLEKWYGTNPMVSVLAAVAPLSNYLGGCRYK